MKICVLLPGIGYTTELPLMYYSGKMALGMGYELVKLTYHDLPTGIKGNREKMKECIADIFRDAEKSFPMVDINFIKSHAKLQLQHEAEAYRMGQRTLRKFKKERAKPFKVKAIVFGCLSGYFLITAICLICLVIFLASAVAHM
jgi:hypothetical protein